MSVTGRSFFLVCNAFPVCLSIYVGYFFHREHNAFRVLPSAARFIVSTLSRKYRHIGGKSSALILITEGMDRVIRTLNCSWRKGGPPGQTVEKAKYCDTSAAYAAFSPLPFVLAAIKKDAPAERKVYSKDIRITWRLGVWGGCWIWRSEVMPIPTPYFQQPYKRGTENVEENSSVITCVFLQR